MRTLVAVSVALSVVFMLGTLAGCGPACDSSNVCAVQGQAGDDTGVCDGSSFITCDDDHRGQVIFCQSQPRKAVCGAGGWSFEYAPLPAQ
jgi:hypothetical protein